MELALAGRQLSVSDLEKSQLLASELEHLVTLFEKIPAIIKLKSNHWQCQRCGNQTEFKHLNKDNVYCINCLQLGRISSAEFLYRIPAYQHQVDDSPLLTWRGQLSDEQHRASIAMCNKLHQYQKIHIIQAVTGAGKTEMIFKVIEKVLQQGGRVAMASPRIDVCLELAPRLQEAFKTVKVITLHGTMTEAYHYTRIVIATTHQLWKFYHAFDLIIVDEVDAFPLAGDDSLHFAVKNAVKKQGKLIYLTATPDSYIEKLIRQKKAERTILPARYHRYPLPEPQFIWIGDWRQQIKSKKTSGPLMVKIKQFLLLKGVKLIFMPDIRLAEALYEWLQAEALANKMAVVHAKDNLRKEKVHQLRQGELSTLISTTILERGVTFTNCQVMIIGSEDRAYSSSAIIQMSGRVGRKPNYPTGQLWYAHYGISLSMIKARHNIRKMNRLARKMGLLND